MDPGTCTTVSGGGACVTHLLLVACPARVSLLKTSFLISLSRRCTGSPQHFTMMAFGSRQSTAVRWTPAASRGLDRITGRPFCSTQCVAPLTLDPFPLNDFPASDCNVLSAFCGDGNDDAPTHYCGHGYEDVFWVIVIIHVVGRVSWSRRVCRRGCKPPNGAAHPHSNENRDDLSRWVDMNSWCTCHIAEEVRVTCFESNGISGYKPPLACVVHPRPVVIQSQDLVPFSSCISVAVVFGTGWQDGSAATGEGRLSVGGVGVAFPD